jgi:hypothetical protein
VFVWIYQNLENDEIVSANRNNILRYLLYCFLTVSDHQNASKKAIEIITESNSNIFPDKEIYLALVEKELSVEIPNPEEYFAPFNTKPDGFLRHHDDIFNVADDKYNSFRGWFWRDSSELLLWFQRSYAAKWFKGYDPMSGDHYDTPYDWDHIMPKSHLIVSGGSLTLETTDERAGRFYNGHNRSLYLNSIGNYRLWPFWANRHDNNICHTYKLRMEDPNWNEYVSKELGLKSTREYLDASLINIEDEDIWYNAGGEPRYWPQERREAWQKAVEQRVLYLYTIFYTEFGFSSWKTV